METCLISNPSTNWDDIVDWYCKLKGKGLQVILCKLYVFGCNCLSCVEIEK
jgi:predicted mannosyl-3-phosphoglycerate phosphatase (HAD superfamily)